MKITTMVAIKGTIKLPVVAVATNVISVALLVECISGVVELHKISVSQICYWLK